MLTDLVESYLKLQPRRLSDDLLQTQHFLFIVQGVILHSELLENLS